MFFDPFFFSFFLLNYLNNGWSTVVMGARVLDDFGFRQGMMRSTEGTRFTRESWGTSGSVLLATGGVSRRGLGNHGWTCSSHLGRVRRATGGLHLVFLMINAFFPTFTVSVETSTYIFSHIVLFFFYIDNFIIYHIYHTHTRAQTHRQRKKITDTRFSERFSEKIFAKIFGPSSFCRVWTCCGDWWHWRCVFCFWKFQGKIW